MRVLVTLVLLGVCSPLLAQSPMGSHRAGRAAAAQRNTAAYNRGCWYRTPDGRWLWVEGTRVLPNGQTALRTFSYYRPPATIYGDDGHPQIIAGTDWYLNGRGPFSD